MVCGRTVRETEILSLSRFEGLVGRQKGKPRGGKTHGLARTFPYIAGQLVPVYYIAPETVFLTFRVGNPGPARLTNTSFPCFVGTLVLEAG